jgi:hypothetical protein
MCDAVDHKAAGTTDPFATVVLKCNWILAFFDQLLVKYVQALEHGHIRVNVIEGITHEPARSASAALPPDSKREAHLFVAPLAGVNVVELERFLDKFLAISIAAIGPSSDV